MKDLLIVIPSRLKAKRLYRKPLRIIKGKTLIDHVYNNIKKINIYKIIVATDSLEIINLCKIKNIPCMMTKKTHQSGSDRVAEVSRKKKFKWILNLQGDEPLINISDIKNLIKKTFKYNKINKKFVVSTLYVRKNFTKNNKNEVKLSLNKKNEVLLFTRRKFLIDKKKKEYFKHVGVYLYKAKFLKKFNELNRSKLEKKENLEQMRVLDNGYKILAFEAKNDTIGVDTTDDLKIVSKII